MNPREIGRRALKLLAVLSAMALVMLSVGAVLIGGAMGASLSDQPR